jgi:25S rRNA (uracil2634-N3)-methyltransferase
LKKKYSRAESNLAKLKEMGAVILHGVDAKRMRLHTDLSMRRFDRVVFNFPHAGFFGKEDDDHVIMYVH